MQERSITIANGLQVTLKVDDKVELKDGRILKVKKTHGLFGKIELVGEDDSVAYAKPVDIIRIVEEVIQAVQEAKGLWALLNRIINFFKNR